MDSNLEISHKLRLRNMIPADYPELAELMRRAYPASMGGAWSQKQFISMITRFPEGQICIEDKGRVVAVALSLIIDYSRYRHQHTYRDIVGDGHLRRHDPNGDYLYGIDVFVHQDYRGLRLGRRLYDARKQLCEELNLRGILLGGRIPGYEKYHDTMTPREYVDKVQKKEIHDPVLTFQLANDFHVKKVLRHYLPTDHQSMSHAALLVWNNIYYEERRTLVGGMKSSVRLGVVQWQMRLFESFEDFIQQVEFFVDTVSGYNADLILFPELFNAPLMSSFEEDDPVQAMRRLAGFAGPLREELVRMALQYNVNIVSGSVPELVEQKLFNVSFLCRRDGTWDSQYKLHITPDESRYWGIQGGDELKIFETDVGKIGILICFDVEYPEAARSLADRGMHLLLVPYWTDTKNAYLRVRRCAQARAIENECFVAMAGSVGNIPKVENMDIQYAQSAVFTPSDFAFPHDAVAAEATANTEMTLICDLDLDLLKELRQQGSVRHLESRRLDLYQVVWHKGREVEST